MPRDLGGGGLDAISLALMDRELGRAAFALQYAVARPSNILRACRGDQIERYLLPAIRGERVECLAMTEPGAGSDLRAMTTRAVRDGNDFVIDGRKHFISYADVADFAVVFAATGATGTARGPRKLLTSFLIDKGTPGFTVRRGAEAVSHRGFHHCELAFDACRVGADQVLGAIDQGFEVANTWLGSTRLTVAAQCVGRARRLLDIMRERATMDDAEALADSAAEIAAAELLTLDAAARFDRGAMTDADAAMAKLHASETLGRVADRALQILADEGLREDRPVARLWRDARVERIWDGTSEIQRLIIARSLLRPREG